MTLALSEDLRFCRSGDRTIFMDIEKGRYFTITNSDAEVFGRWHEGKAVDVGEVVPLAKLNSQGVLVDAKPHRTAERSVGKECVSTCIYRGSQDHSKNNIN